MNGTNKLKWVAITATVAIVVVGCSFLLITTFHYQPNNAQPQMPYEWPPSAEQYYPMGRENPILVIGAICLFSIISSFVLVLSAHKSKTQAGIWYTP